MKPCILYPLLAMAFFTSLPAAFAEDCDLAQQYYLQGLTKGKFERWTEARDLLQKSVSLCNRFNNWYLLGQTHFELGDYDDAASAFEDARRYATAKDERAIAIGRYAQVQSAQGLVNQPLTLLREAYKMHSKAPAWMMDLTKKLDEKRIAQPLTVAQVTGALTNKSIKLLNLNAEPSLNVSINFEFDSVQVIDQSRSSVEVLGKALMEETLRSKSVTIVGHTDKTGSIPYNAKLSERRAKSIAAILYKKFPGLKGRISVAGKGEAQPLYPGNSEWENQMNRRIEVKVRE